MGIWPSKYDQYDQLLFARPVKRLKTEDDARLGLNVNNCSTLEKDPQKDEPTDQQFLPRPLWDRLPYVALLEIYRHLSNNDKYSAALTCKNWSLPFSRPALWRRGHFLFNGVDDWRALCFASMMGAALRHVTADCSASSADMSATSALDSATKLAVFLRTIKNADNCSLVTLELNNLSRMAKYVSSLDIIRLLTSILKHQTQLRRLSLCHADFDVEQGMQLLFAACTSCPATLENLFVEEFVQPKSVLDAETDNRFICAISRLSNLTELGLSHSYLSDSLLFLLSGSVPEKLRLLKVWARYFGRAERRTTPEAWAHLCFRCPGLRAHFVISGVSNDQTFCDILTTSIPLTDLFWNSGNYTTMVNTKICFDHIMTYFQKHLQHLELDLHYAFLDDEEDMAAIVERCPLLETLTVTSKFTLPPRQVRLERAIRRAVMRQPASRLHDVIINGKIVDLEETWLASVVGWLVEHVH